MEQNCNVHVHYLIVDNMMWSVPSQKGVNPTGRHGHTSVYLEEVGVVYVYGGRGVSDIKDTLVTFNVTTYTW